MKKELIIYRLERLVKNYFYIFILLILSLAFFSPIITSSKTLDNIHYINDMTFQSENIRKWLFDSAGFPLWTPYFYAGQPFLAIPEHYIFDLNLLYIFLSGNIYLAMNLAVISYFFLAGLGMFLLAYNVARNRNAAFIAAIIFMFNGFMRSFILTGHLNILESYALMPYVFLFAYKAINGRECALNSAIAALFLSMMVYAGGIIFLLYTGLIVGSYLAFSLIGKNFRRRLAKTFYAALAIGVLLFGLSALKLLPILEFANQSNRGEGVNYLEFLGEPIDLSRFWNYLIYIPDMGFSTSIGIFAFILVLSGLMSLRKKIVVFSLLLVMLSILLASGSLIAGLFYNLPGFGQMRHIERALVIFAFAAPLLAAQGYNNLISIIRNHSKSLRERVIFSIIVLILVIELILLQNFPRSAEITKPLDIPILNEISKDKGNFRIATYALSTPIGASGYNYYAQLGIPSIKGGGGIWMNDYVQYIAIAQQAAPSKMFGLLNGKYVISDRNIIDEGLKLKGIFEKCEGCPVWEAYGPYLYENMNIIPQASVIDKAILILGNDKDVRDLSYNLLISNLNPLSTVFMQGKAIEDYSLNELKKFNALILLSGSVNQNDIYVLQQYADSGREILPNILEGKSAITQNDIDGLLDNGISGNELILKRGSVNEYSVELNGEEGWLVFSEKFAHFPEWKAILNGKNLKMYKADIIISAVYLEGEKGKLAFKYDPFSFAAGKIITTITILIITVFFGYKAYTRTRR